MRLPRMTTRRWMVVVALVGLLMGGAIGGIRLKQRHDYFLSWARYHSAFEGYRRNVAQHDHDPVLARMIDHNAMMARKYREAARYPWLPVEPDPPEPE